MTKSHLKKLWLTLAVCLVLLALLLSVVRAITPLFSKYRGELQTFASQLMDHPVRISRVSASWRGLQPILKFSNVVILNDEGTKPLLKVKKLEIGVDLLASLKAWELTPGLFVVSGAHVTVHHTPEDKILIDGISRFQPDLNVAEYGQQPQQFLGWILKQDEISLQDVDIHLIGKNKRVIPISGLEFALLNDGRSHRVEGVGRLAQTVASQFRFVLNMQGVLEEPDDWQGALYFRGQDIIVTQWLQGMTLAGFKPTSGRFAFELWANIAKSQLKDLQGQFDIDYLSLQYAKKTKLLQDAIGNFSLEKTEQGWQFIADKIRLKMHGRYWPSENQLKVQVGKFAENSKQNRIYLRYLNLQDVLPFVAEYPQLPKLLKEALPSLQPQGELENVYLDYDDDFQDWRLQSDIYLKSSNAWQALPELKQLTARIKIDPAQGDLTIASKSFSIFLPKLFAKALAVESLQGELEWRKQQGRWLVRSEKLFIQNHDAALEGRFVLTLPTAGAASLDLLAGFQINDLSRARDYLPTKLLPKKLVAWLNAALLRGKVNDGHLVFRGDLKDFPFSDHSGMFLVDSQIEKADLNYWEDWPEADDLSGNLIFRNRGLEANLASGKLSGMSLQNMHAAIPLLSKTKSVLSLEGDLKGDLANTTKFLLNSPLKKRFLVLKDLSLTGPTHTRIKLLLPFSDLEKNLVIQGAIAVDTGDVQLPDWQLQMGGLKGLLRFTEDKVYAKNIRANLFGKPVVVAIRTVKTKKGKTYNELAFSGKTDIKTLYEHFKFPVLDYLSGTTNYKAVLSLPAKENIQQHLSVTSDLHGVKINLPQPVGKAAKTKSKLKLGIDFGANKERKVKIDYAKLLSAALTCYKVKEEADCRSGEVRLGGGHARFQKQRGLLISGYVNRFSLNQWRSFLLKDPDNKKSKQMLSFKGAVRRLDVQLGHLFINSYDFSNIKVKGTRQKQGWLWRLSAPYISGEFSVPDNLADGIAARLDRLYLQPVKGKKGAIGEQLKPAETPPLDIVVNDFRFGNKQFGQVQLLTATKNNRVLVQQFAANNPDFTINAKGDWGFRDGKQVSTLQGVFISNHFANTLARLQIPAAIDSKKGQMQFDLYWPGSLHQISLGRVDGNVKLRLDRGRITKLNRETESKIGMGKLLSILSLQTLPRRLVLDFSDLAGKGFTFDTLQGDFKLNEGDAKTENTFLKGPIADVDLRGKIGLASETYDLVLNVAPHVTASLPVVMTIAGGPIAGVVTWVADKVLHKGIRKVSAYTYKVTGPWKKPVVEQVSIKSSHQKHQTRRKVS